MDSQNNGNPQLRHPQFPEGLVGGVARYIYGAAPYPNETIAITGAIGFVAGIAGRAFNVENAGLNQYLLALAPTGTGKEAISAGTSKLLNAAWTKCPEITKVRGPGQLVSGSGLYKWLARLANPTVFSVIGEFGLMLKALAAPNANANMALLQKVLLELYGKSEHGAGFDGAAYSDRENVTDVIRSPSLTIIGEGVPETFYGALDEAMIRSGLLPRFLIFETDAPRPRLNRNRATEPPEALVEAIARLANETLSLAHLNTVRRVPLSPEATAMFDDYEAWTGSQVNGAITEATRHLWSRAHLKALKLAALVAVGRDPINPCLEYREAKWGADLVHDQTWALVRKFESGDVGEATANEAKQQAEVCRVMREFAEAPFDKVSKYGATAEMHKGALCPHAYISVRCLNLHVFPKGSKGEATAALQRTIKTLVDNGEIEEVPRHFVWETYGVKPRTYRFAQRNPKSFFAEGKPQFFDG